MSRSDDVRPVKAAKPGKFAIISGWILTMIIGLMLVVGGSVQLFLNAEEAVKQSVASGYPESSAKPIMVVMILIGLLYLFPRTAVFGGLLLIGYLGGAVATHVQLEDGLWFIPIIFGIVAWIGLYLRDRRLRALVFWRKPG